ncbi:cancer/testis antigen 47A-like [Equus caballus]|uniref:cancer/testis antigen 47A-like n=1 Tax=Equus caballus TaxID=9796 RepID=UPI0038B39CFB
MTQGKNQVRRRKGRGRKINQKWKKYPKTHYFAECKLQRVRRRRPGRRWPEQACGRAGGVGPGGRLVGDSGPHGVARVTAAAAGALGEAAGEPGAGGPEGGSAEEDSDIEPAEEGEEAAAGRLAVDAAQFPRASLRLLFLEFAQSLLRRLFYNNHVLLRPWPLAHDGLAQRPAPRGPAPQELAACALPPVQEPGKGATTQEPGAETATQEPGAEAATQEPAEEAAAPEETTKYRCENSNEEAHDAEDKDEKEKFNKKQEGPENALDPTDSTPRKSSWEE